MTTDSEKAFKYLAQVSGDSSLQFAHKEAHESMMQTALMATMGLQGDVARLRDDNERLRALIREAMNQKNMTSICPWCRLNIDSVDDLHETWCDAFTPEGEVR